MKCIYNHEDIEKFLEGIFSLQEADKIENHIKVCKKCSSYYEALQLFSKFTSNNTAKCNINEKILLHRIDRDRYLNNKYSILNIFYKISPVIKPMSAIAVAILLFTFVIFNSQNPSINNIPISLQSPLVTSIYTPASTHIKITEEDSTKENSVQKVIPLAFEKVDFEQKIEILYKNSIEKVIQEHNAEGSTFFIFNKKNDDFNKYLGVKLDKLYEVGQVGYGNFEPQIKSTFLFGKSLIRIDGIVGSTSPVTYYIDMENNVPKIFLYLNGTVNEIDVDSDGNNYIISTVLGSTEIYKAENGQLIYSSLNKTLNAERVHYLGEKNDFIFVAYSEASGYLKYKLTKEGLLLLGSFNPELEE